MARDSNGLMAWHNALGLQQGALNAISADMPAKLALDLLEKAKASESSGILKLLNGTDASLAISLVQQNKKWAERLSGISSLEKIWTREGRLLSDGFAEYAERARAQLATVNTLIGDLYGNEAIKDLLRKHAESSQVQAEDGDDDEAVNFSVDTQTALEASQSLRLAIQSLSETASVLHKLATSPNAKNSPIEHGNVLSVLNFVLALMALFVAIANPFWDAYVKECLIKGDAQCKGYRESLSAAKQPLKDDASFDLYRTTRRIAARNLTLRLNPKGLSPAVASIHSGALVVVLREGTDWTLIEAEVSGSKLAGWVYTRYLSNI